MQPLHIWKHVIINQFIIKHELIKHKYLGGNIEEGELEKDKVNNFCKEDELDNIKRKKIK